MVDGYRLDQSRYTDGALSVVCLCIFHEHEILLSVGRVALMRNRKLEGPPPVGEGARIAREVKIPQRRHRRCRVRKT